MCRRPFRALTAGGRSNTCRILRDRDYGQGKPRIWPAGPAFPALIVTLSCVSTVLQYAHTAGMLRLFVFGAFLFSVLALGCGMLIDRLLVKRAFRSRGIDLTIFEHQTPRQRVEASADPTAILCPACGSPDVALAVGDDANKVSHVFCSYCRTTSKLRVPLDRHEHEFPSVAARR